MKFFFKPIGIFIFSSLLVLNALSASSSGHQPQFSIAGFYPLKGTGRTAYSMNLAWRFIKSDVKNAESVSFDDSKWQVVSVPHGLEYLPIDASGSINYQGIAWYRKHFKPDKALKGKKLFLHFEAIMGKSKVWVNGRLVKEYFGGYLPVIAEISSYLKWDEDNVIAVLADNSDDPTYPPGKSQDVLDFSYFGGIYRDCWLVAHNNVYITNSNYENEIAGGGVFVSYDKVSYKSATINLKLHIRNDLPVDFKGSIEYELIDNNNKIVHTSNLELSISKLNSTYSKQFILLNSPKLWSPESPHLYHLNMRIKDSNGKVIDGFMQRIGVRSIEFRQTDGLWINGKLYIDKIIGVNRHQDYAVIGNAIPNSLQWRDAKKFRDAGLKVVRTHYVIDPAFMDACDELGIFALVSVPGWQFWNKAPIFQGRVFSDIRNMVRIHRNHASLFFWEPVLNETNYPASFAKGASDIIKEEYPYPYSEVGSDDGSEGTEYYNILFRPVNKLDSTKTYFIREWGDNVDNWIDHNGNSRVNRGWGENPMLIQAKHYASPAYNTISLERLYKDSRHIIGGSLWHSFDHQRGYHPDPFFGGIMDAFRQPKYSYYMFESQRDPLLKDTLINSGPMVYIAHEFSPFSSKDVTVYSNCDEVRLTFLKDGKSKIYKKDKNRIGMPSPIITFEDMYDFMAYKAKSRAGKLDEIYLLAEGLIDGKVVATHKVVPAQRPQKVILWIDDEGTKLIADGSDVVTIIAAIADEKGNIKRLSTESIKFEIEGEGTLLGGSEVFLNPRPAIWGTAPMLVQSTTKPGKIIVRASVSINTTQKPISGELIINSVANQTPAIYSEKELVFINQIKAESNGVNGQIKKSELELEIQKLKKELNDIRLKEVEKEQNKFGKGLN